MKLLETANFMGDEVPPENGERWLGLFVENGNYFLRSTTVSISTSL
jgi:hypothetical protein